jgi:hypothetical protein
MPSCHSPERLAVAFDDAVANAGLLPPAASRPASRHLHGWLQA